SAAIAARRPASALESPLGVVSAAAGPAPGKTGQEWLADSRCFEAGCEAGEGRNRETGLGSGIIGRGGIAPRSLRRKRGRRRLRSGDRRTAAEVRVH
ncbi:MAG: hypothetical protein ACK55I_48775, partial [bacterium]